MGAGTRYQTGSNTVTPWLGNTLNTYGYSYDFIAGTNNARHLGTSMTAGKVVAGTKFDGINDYVRVADGAAGSDFGSGGFSIVFWIKAGPQAVTSPCILSKDLVQNHEAYIVNLESGDLWIHLNYSGAAFGWGVGSIDADFADNSWHLAAVTVQGGSSASVRWYKDGVLNRSACCQNLPGSISNTADLLMGACEPASGFLQRFFTGELDEVQFFNRILTESEIRAIYDAESAGVCGCRTC